MVEVEGRPWRLLISTLPKLTITQRADAQGDDVRVLPTDADVLIFAAQVTVDGPVHLPGRCLEIHAQRLTVVPGTSAALSVVPLAKVNPQAAAPGGDVAHGSVETPAARRSQLPRTAADFRLRGGQVVFQRPSSLDPKPEDFFAFFAPTWIGMGASVGRSGMNGADGLAAGAAGDPAPAHDGASIRLVVGQMLLDDDLVLDVQGGAGAPGQSGQSGAQGEVGIETRNASGDWAVATSGPPPSFGGFGGDGGKASVGGNGGAGGTIDLAVAELSGAGTLLPRVSGGGAGRAGQPGEGGQGVLGGQWTWPGTVTMRAPASADGMRGALVGQPAQPGASGSTARRAPNGDELRRLRLMLSLRAPAQLPAWTMDDLTWLRGTFGTQSIVPHTTPLAGNAFITTRGPNDQDAQIDDFHLDAGKLTGWVDPATVISFFFYVGPPAGSDGAAIRLVASRPAGGVDTVVNVKLANATIPVTISSDAPTAYWVGYLPVSAAGYLRVDISGVTGNPTFADIAALWVTTESGLVCVNIQDLPGGFTSADRISYYNFARRGPSLHLIFDSPPEDKNEYFYSEVSLPSGFDPLGTYAAVAAFDGGYCGIQRINQTPKGTPCRGLVMFSAWDTDSKVPALRAKVVALGVGVETKPFGGEGEGAQTVLPYDWSAATTYKIVVRAKRDGGDALLTAWFFADGAWRPIATIRRPGVAGSVSGIYHFIENFRSPSGYLQRRAIFRNQWVRANGAWKPLVSARLHGDELATKGQRLDISAGTDGGSFHLGNGGFVTDGTRLTQDDGKSLRLTHADNPSQTPVNVDVDLQDPTLPPPT
jgi:hypothetical protein